MFTGLVRCGHVEGLEAEGLIVHTWVTALHPLSSLGMLNWIVSGPVFSFASRIACLRLPFPESAVFVTVKMRGAAEATEATSASARASASKLTIALVDPVLLRFTADWFMKPPVRRWVWRALANRCKRIAIRPLGTLATYVDWSRGS
jgi:hypothetical protein